MRTPLLGAATVAVLAAGALATTGVLGSSHREAPRIMLDPTADNTDVYAFTAQDAPGKLTVVANWVPLEDPAGGPYFGKLDPKARYYVKIDNTGDGVEDVAYRWQFHRRVPQPELVPVRGADGRLDQRPEPQLRPDLRPLHARRYRQRQAVRGQADRPRRAGRAEQRRPEDDPRTTTTVAAGRSRRCTAAARRSSARPTTRSSSTSARSSTASTSTSPAPGIGLGNQGGGKDDLAGYNVHSFVLQVPEARRHARRQAGRPARTRQRRRRRVGVHRAPARSGRRDDGKRHGKRDWVQVCRLGNPLINEVIIPLGAEGQVQPRPRRRTTLKNFGKYALNPEPARLMNALFNLGVKETDRTDIVQALLTGVPG